MWPKIQEPPRVHHAWMMTLKRAVEAKKVEAPDEGQWKEFRGQRIRYVECKRYHFEVSVVREEK